MIYRIVTDFDVIPNIRRAAIENHLGWMVVELDGDPEDIRKAKQYLAGQGIGAERAEGDIVEAETIMWPGPAHPARRDRRGRVDTVIVP